MIRTTISPISRWDTPTIRSGSITTLSMTDEEKAAARPRRPVGFNFAAPASEYPRWCDGCVDLGERCADHA